MTSDEQGSTVSAFMYSLFMLFIDSTVKHVFHFNFKCFKVVLAKQHCLFTKLYNVPVLLQVS